MSPFLLAKRVLARRMPQLSPSQRHTALLLRFKGWAETGGGRSSRRIARGQSNLACARKQQSISATRGAGEDEREKNSI